jgi:predicted cobalt transporter CbtA
VNTEARLNALKIGLLIMAGVALLALIPASGLPNDRPAQPGAARPARQREEDAPA